MQELVALKALQNGMCALQVPFAGVPVTAQMEIIGCKGCGKELEYCQGDTAGVHLFEHQANGLFRSLLTKLDDWYLILLETLDYVLFELVEQLHFLGVVVPMFAVPQSPIS